LRAQYAADELIDPGAVVPALHLGFSSFSPNNGFSANVESAILGESYA
jgi:hypothetical protein